MDKPRPKDLPQDTEVELPQQVLIMDVDVHAFNARVNAVMAEGYTVTEHGIFTQPNNAATGAVAYGVILEQGV